MRSNRVEGTIKGVKMQQKLTAKSSNNTRFVWSIRLLLSLILANLTDYYLHIFNQHSSWLWAGLYWQLCDCLAV